MARAVKTSENPEDKAKDSTPGLKTKQARFGPDAKSDAAPARTDPKEGGGTSKNSNPKSARSKQGSKKQDAVDSTGIKTDLSRQDADPPVDADLGTEPVLDDELEHMDDSLLNVINWMAWSRFSEASGQQLRQRLILSKDSGISQRLSQLRDYRRADLPQGRRPSSPLRPKNHLSGSQCSGDRDIGGSLDTGPSGTSQDSRLSAGPLLVERDG
jgi:hypothetical protein